MSGLRPLLVLALSVFPSLGATFGTVVQHAQPISDLVLDEARKRLYLVVSGSSQVEVYSTASNPPRLAATIKTDATPLAAALSRSGKYLYVACYDGSSLDIIDVSSTAFATQSLSLAAKPQSVAVGFDEKVLIGTAGTSTGQDVLVTYNPSANATSALQAISVGPGAPIATTEPPPNGVAYLSIHSRLQATPDGKTIIGVNDISPAQRTVFVYDAASSTVFSARSVPGLSPTLAVSADGSRFLSGPILFETATLLVMAQQSTANSPYVFPSTANFPAQTNQGGAVFAPDGTLLAAYNIVPVASPAVRPNTSQLVVNTPDNLTIQLGIQLPESLGGKMVSTADGTSVYALSQSGFTLLPMGTLQQQPIAMPDSNVALLAFDQCGVTAAQNSAVIPVRNVGGGKLTATVSLLQTAIGGTTTTSPSVHAAAKSYGADVTASFNAAAARSLGTATPDQLLIQSPEAVNIVPNVRVFQNNRSPESRGSILPVDMGASTTGLLDMVSDSARQRLYIANTGLNRIEVFDLQQQQFLTPIRVGQLPRSMAMGLDGNSLYVANSGGESVGIVNLNAGAVSGEVRFPPIPFNGAEAVITPQAIATTQRGQLTVMSDGSLWRVVGNSFVPFPLNPNIFGTGVTRLTTPVTLSATPDGSFLLVLTGAGVAYLYSASIDDFVTGRQVLPTPVAGYFGPITALANGQYYLTDDQILNSALTSIGPGGSAARPVAAVTAVGAQSFGRFSTAPRASTTTAPADAGLVELVDASTQRTTASANSLESPLTVVATGQRANISGRTMAVDASGATAYVLTTSGMSIVPLNAAAGTPPSVTSVLSMANSSSNVAAGSIVSIFGKNLAGTATSSGAPLPTLLGGTCVTLNGAPIPLLATSGTQINVELPPNLTAARYPLVIHSIANQAASASLMLSVLKYAPAVFVDAQGAAIYHANGQRVNQAHPGQRDEELTIYASGLGPTTGGAVVAGEPAPSSPLAVTGLVQVFFGNPSYKQAQLIVDWSGLSPGMIGVYQINCRIPGFHIKGNALPVTLRVSNVSSPSGGSSPPLVWVQ